MLTLDWCQKSINVELWRTLSLLTQKVAPMTITPHIFEAYLKCPMKCWLLATGKHLIGNTYAEWVNKAGYWDYQRSRIFLRTDKRVKAAEHKIITRQHHPARINQYIELHDRPSCCPKCGHKKIELHNWLTSTVYDLKFSNTGLKKWVVRYRYHRFLCCSCNSTFYAPERPWSRSKYGPNLRSYIIFQLIELRIPQTTVDRSLAQLFGMNIKSSISNGQKLLGSRIYTGTYETIMRRIVAGQFIHADETRISIDNHDAYVWVLANHDAVAYLH